ncbi:MAG: penicillin-binding protein 2 [Parcubacteria group bacterium]
MNGLRSNLIILLIFLASATVIGRLFYFQVLNYQYWRAMAQGQQNTFKEVLGERGEIFLEGNSLPVAQNRDATFVYMSPAEIRDQENTVKILSEILGRKEELILEKLKNSGSLFELLKDNLSDQELEAINRQNLQGIYVGSKRQRYYPQGTLVSNILGFVDKNGDGQYGLEGYYNNILKGQENVLQGEKWPQGFLFFAGDNQGSDLNLTIDYNIQFMSEKLLKNAVENLGAEGGQIIVVDPASGAIIALADYPNFDPNYYSDYSKEDWQIFKNSAAQDLFEPGSALKPITMAIGLEEGKIGPKTTYIDEGFVKFGGNTLYNYDGRKYGQQTMTQVLEKSINTGAVFVEELIAHNVFIDYLNKFGLFEKTGIDTQEVFSENKELKKGYDVNYATAAYGQGIEMTSMQLMRAFCALVNGGKMPRLYLVDKITENGKIVKTQPEFSDQIISSKTSSQVTAMMVSVVENGYGKAAKIPGYYIGGKTGTAQIPYSALGINKSGYSEKTIQSFIGFGPAFLPKFVILVKLDNPKAKTAEYSAVPVFQDLAKYIINYWQLAPDYQL